MSLRQHAEADALEELAGRMPELAGEAGLTRNVGWPGGTVEASVARVQISCRINHMSYLYGLEHANKDFTEQKNFGKNVFTNAFPLALAQYMAIEKQLEVVEIRSIMDQNGFPSTAHNLVPWATIMHTDPRNAYFCFESVFEPYRQYTNAENPNPSDVVIMDAQTYEPLHPLELKLVVVPNSSTAKRPRIEQSCEVVSRPATVEQIAFSIAHGFTSTRRYDLQRTIQSHLGMPNEFNWHDKNRMIKSLPKIVRATESIIETGIDLQRPLVMVAIWRSKGQNPLLDEENAFDTFIWTDLSFLQLYLNATRNTYLDERGELRSKNKGDMTRAARALIWFIRSLWDYSTQHKLDFPRVQGDASYGRQSDKAAAFTRGARDLLMSDQYLYPRVAGREVDAILKPEAHGFLLPERRLDASLSLRFALEGHG